MTLNKTSLPAKATLLGALWSPITHAHDGHGLAGSHWHASDTWGFIAFVVAAAVAVWFTRNGK